MEKGAGEITSAAFHPSEDLYAVCVRSSDGMAAGEVQLRSAADGKLLASVPVGIWPDSLAFSPDVSNLKGGQTEAAVLLGRGFGAEPEAAQVDEAHRGGDDRRAVERVAGQLAMQRRAQSREPPTQVDDAIVSIDQTIRQIRNTILVLRSTAADRLDQLFTGIVSETATLLGFAPALSMDAAARRVTGPLAADLAPSLREAMSNVVRHAQASAVDLSVRVADGRVVVTVSDDGVGIQSDRRSGLENLGERARAHGGTFTVESEIGEGTTLTWDMPLPPVL